MLRCLPFLLAVSLLASPAFAAQESPAAPETEIITVRGERSGPQFAMMAQWAHERLPNSETETFAGTTHFVPMEACAQLVDRIRTFSEKSSA